MTARTLIYRAWWLEVGSIYSNGPECNLPPDERFTDCSAPHNAGHARAESPEEAILLGKTKCILTGVPFFEAVFHELGCTVEWLAKEGDVIEPPMKVAIVRGPCRCILLGERTALNIITRASGIATAARELVDLARGAGWHGYVAGTRKVTPGFRLVEKYALLAGGAATHRQDLSQMVMLKGECWVVLCASLR